MKMSVYICTSILLLISMGLHAEDEIYAKKIGAQDIAHRYFKQLSQFSSLTADLHISMYHRNGRRRGGWAKLAMVNHGQDETRSLLVVTKPKIKSGTKLLTANHTLANDEAWVYMPRSKTTKEINASAMESRFMGTQFSFEDFLGWRFEDFTFEYENMDSHEGVVYYVINAKLVNSSQYTRQKMWISEDTFMPLKIEFYDNQDHLTKVISLNDYFESKPNAYIPQKISMFNPKNGKTTEIEWLNIEINVELDTSLFDVDNLPNVNI